MAYLGNIIGVYGRSPTLPIAEKIQKFKSIKSKKYVMETTGATNWFRPYIQNLSTKIKKLTALLRNNREIE